MLNYYDILYQFILLWLITSVTSEAVKSKDKRQSTTRLNGTLLRAGFRNQELKKF